MKHYVVISAHPDDLEMSCSGTVMKLLDEGNKVTSIVMAGDVPQFQFLDRASHAVGLKPVGLNPIVFSMGKERFSANRETVAKLEKLIDFSSVDTVITHWKEDWHQDHRACYEIGNILRRKQPMDLWYMSSYPYNLKYKEFSPSMYVDVKKYYIRKIAAMKSYENLTTDWLRGVQSHDAWRGSFISAAAAEVFMVDNMVM